MGRRHPITKKIKVLNVNIRRIKLNTDVTSENKNNNISNVAIRYIRKN